MCDRSVGVGILLVLFTAMISGLSTFVNFWAVQGTNSDAFIAVRNALVAVMLIPLFLVARSNSRRNLHARDWLRLILIGLVGGAVPFLLFFRGLQIASLAGAATATFGYRSLFLIATILGVAFLSERFSSRVALAAGLMLGGNALLLSLTAPVWTDGTVLVLVATVLWACEYTVSKRTLRDLPSTTVAFGRMGFGGIFLLAYVAITGQLISLLAFTGPQLEWIGISALLLLGFVTTWYAGLRYVDLSVATPILVLGFPLTWILGVLAGRTTFGIAQAAGAVAIGFGVILVVGLASMRGTWVALDRALRATFRGAPWR